MKAEKIVQSYQILNGAKLTKMEDADKFKGTFYEFYLFDKTLFEDEINYYKSKMQ